MSYYVNNNMVELTNDPGFLLKKKEGDPKPTKYSLYLKMIS